jgi:site-specific DNA-methyltransferase (adenine-specific)
MKYINFMDEEDEEEIEIIECDTYQEDVIDINLIPFPNKKYNIIYADPPWSFHSRELQKYDGKRFSSMDKHYETQENEWIYNLPVKDIADIDCALFLWVTDAHIEAGLETIKSWGFKYKTIIFVWEKLTSTGKLASNFAPWTLKNTEICLFGTKGAMHKYKRVNNMYQLVKAVRTEHSKKPDEIRNNIEKLFGDIPRIELFARKQIKNWDVWGNEVNIQKGKN